MAEDEETCKNNLIVRALDKIDHKLEKIQDEQIDQGKTLVRNTVTLEEHIRRTEILETKMGHVESEMGGIKSCMTRVENTFDFFKPTKYKVKVLLIAGGLLASIYGGQEVVFNDNSRKTVMETIQKILK